MAKSGYSITTQGAVTLSASTAKTILAIKAGSDLGVDLLGFDVGFVGTTVTDAPVLIELCACTFGSAGTSSSATVRQLYGRAAGTGFTGSRNYSAEPTALTVIRECTLTPAGGTIVYDYPLGMSPDSPLGEGFALRCTAGAGVNVHATLRFERA